MITVETRETTETSETTTGWEDVPVPYYLHEVLYVRALPRSEIREIHRAKISYPGLRVIQDFPEEGVKEDEFKGQ